MLKWLAKRFEQQRGALQSKLEQSIQNPSLPEESAEPVDWRVAGNAFLDAGNLVEAARCYQNAVDAMSTDVAALVNLAFVKLELKSIDGAHGLLDRAVLVEPTNVDAWYLLGGIHESRQDLLSSEAAFREAIRLKPDFELAYRDLCRVMFQSGQLQSAKSIVLKGIALNPAFADFHFYLGNVLFFEADYLGATASFEKTLALQPEFAQAHINLAKILEKQHRFDEAVVQCQSALAMQPNNAEFHNHLGNVHLLCGRVQSAVDSYKRAIVLEPDQYDAYLNMGRALVARGDCIGAVDHCRTAIRLKPELALSHNFLGIALQELGRTQEALAAFRQALTVNPDMASALCNIGSVHLSEARLDDAIEQYQKALRIEPDNEAANGNLLFALNYHPELDAAEIFSAYQRFNREVGLPLRATWMPFANIRSANRRLRIGYVSPDFRQHSVMLFLGPVLARHDLQAFDIYAYAEVIREDGMTAVARKAVTHWRSTVGLNDEAVAAMIREDGIDVLVDVAGHTGGSRLRVFARKPAPVSISWMGYGYTTGLSAIDYYLTDAVAVPLGFESLFAELPWRMDRTSYVYRPDPVMGTEGALPALSRGYVTFATLTRPVRVNQRVVRVWAEILRRVPRSRLVVDSKSYADVSTRDALVAQFLALGVQPERLQIGYHSPPWELMRGVDISLDCFPHNSGTTLFESLYMGVPYVTLAGRPSVGRLGASILHGVGHPEWIAHSEEEYVDIVLALAQDLGALSGIRAALRKQMQQSCLMDEVGFTRDLENAYRSMFAAWAEKDVEPTAASH